MLMLCLAIRPPGTAALDMFKDKRNSSIKILRRKPGHIGLSPEPGLLPLGEPSRSLHGIANRLLERPLPFQVTDELPGDLLDPALFYHPGHSARYAIV